MLGSLKTCSVGGAAILFAALSVPLQTYASLAEPPSDPAPLAGPKVVEARANSIVEITFEGTVRRPDATPERAAIDLLNLEKERFQRIEKIFARRAAIFQNFIENNIDLLTKAQAAGAAGDVKDLLSLGFEAYTKLEPLRKGGSLEEQIRVELTSDQSARFTALLDEYWESVVSEGRRIKDKNGKPKNRLGAIAEERLRILGREVEVAFYGLEKSGLVGIEYLLDGITLTEAQRQRVNELKSEMAEASFNEDGTKNGEQFGAQILAILDEQQRAIVIKKIMGM